MSSCLWCSFLSGTRFSPIIAFSPLELFPDQVADGFAAASRIRGLHHKLVEVVKHFFAEIVDFYCEESFQFVVSASLSTFGVLVKSLRCIRIFKYSKSTLGELVG